jgi:hypothetical protein
MTLVLSRWISPAHADRLVLAAAVAINRIVELLPYFFPSKVWPPMSFQPDLRLSSGRFRSATRSLVTRI